MYNYHHKSQRVYEVVKHWLKMNSKVFFVLCIVVCATQALPQNGLSAKTNERLISLGLGLNDSFNYNEFILNLESVIETFQQVALSAIETTVELAQQFTKAVAKLGAQENIKEISDIQTAYFKKFEALRHEAYDQNIDISSCISPAVQQIYNESQSSVKNITMKLEDITNIFTNYTSENYLQPAKEHLLKSYKIRERIYECPFSFTDFTPFYLCLAIQAVLDDIVILNDFSLSFNDTASNVYKLVIEFGTSATYFRDQNFKAFNDTALSIYNNDFVPCSIEKGFNL